MKRLKPEEFFREVALNARVVDLRVVKDVYYGLVRTMARNLTAKHAIWLPDWGEFKLKVCKSRRTYDVTTGGLIVLPPKALIKFVAVDAVKEHFYELGEDGTMVE